MGVNRWLGGYTGATTTVNQTGNWSTSTLPVAGDDVYIEANPGGTDYALDTGLSSLASIILTSLNISQTFTADIGTSAAYFQIQAATVNIGYQYGGTVAANGSNRVKLNLGTTSASIGVTTTGASPSDSGMGAVQILTAHTSSTFSVQGGSVSVAMLPGETASMSTFSAIGGSVFIGPLVTLPTLNIQTASVQVQNALTTVNQEAGNLTTYGSGAITTLNNWGGVVVANSTGTITTLNASGQIDFTQSTATRTVTNCNVYGGAHSILLDNGKKNSVIFTNGIIGNNTRPNVSPWVTSTLSLS